MTEHPPRTTSKNDRDHIEQGGRNVLAQSVREVRKKRDAQRVVSETWRSRLGRMVGNKKALGERQATTQLHTEAQRVLTRGKSSIEEYAESRRRAKEYTERIFGPLETLSSSGTEHDAHQFLQTLDRNELRTLIANPQFAHTLSESLSSALKQSTPHVFEETMSIISDLVESQLTEPEPFFLQPSNPLLSGDALTSLRTDLQEKVMARMEEQPAFLVEALKNKQRLDVAKFIFVRKSAIGIKAFREVCKEELTTSLSNLTDYTLYAGPLPEMKAEARKIVADYVADTFSIPFDQLEPSWRYRVSTEFNSPSYLRTFPHLEVMDTIEKRIPGGVKRLYEHYGITYFGRYPTDLLISQLEEEDTEQPYGVVVFPRADWNQAFVETSTPLSELYTQTRGRHGIKVFEVASTQDIARQFIKLNRAYKHKIAFAVLGGHGNEFSIQFGDALIRGSHLWRSNVQSSGTSRARDFFESEPSLILISCSTGKEGGIGQRMSSAFGAQVIGPDVATTTKSIKVTYSEDGKPSFAVTYESGSAKRYINGNSVGEPDGKA